ncbi:hypothetical protein T439DRAFT_383018 [Meredithblackwellia eburnea MCA 4105]
MSRRGTASTGKRSRTGCSVCLTRKRKCDEEWMENGSCQRCHKAGLECIRNPARPSSETTRVLAELRYLEPSKPPIPTTNSRGKQPTPTAPTPVPTSSTSAIPPITPVNSCPAEQNNLSHRPGAQGASFHEPLFNLTSQSSTSSSFPAMDTFLPPLRAFELPVPLLGPTSSAFLYHPTPHQPERAPSTASHNRTVFDNSYNSAKQLDVTEYEILANLATNNARLGIEMASRSGGGYKGGGESAVDGVSDADNVGRDDEVYMLYANVNAFRDPLYVSLNDSYYRSFPKRIRLRLHQEYDSYMSTYEVTRSSSLAMSLLYYSRNQPNGSPKQQRLLAHSQSMYFRTMELLQRTPTLPLEVIIYATLDLYYCQIESIGGAGVSGAMSLADLFVKSRLGEDFELDFSAILSPRHIPLLFYAYYDILRAVASPTPRRLMTEFKGMPGRSVILPLCPDDRKWLKGVSASPFGVHLGLPIPLALCFAGIATLEADMDSEDTTSTLLRANEIEEAIRAWKPEIPYDNDEPLGGYKAIVAATTQEMWRQAALIYLHSSIHKMGCMSRALRIPTLQILQLGSVTYGDSPGESDHQTSMSHRACAWFFAATCYKDWTNEY